MNTLPSNSVVEIVPASVVGTLAECNVMEDLLATKRSENTLKGEKVKTYRDTTGIPPVAFKRMLQVPNRRTVKGKRDYALLRLLWDNVLRREEVCQANLEDLDLEGKTLKILGKGKGTQKETVTLSKPTVEALQDWLQARRELKRSKPLFIALDRASYGHRLTGTGVYKIVSQIARLV